MTGLLTIYTLRWEREATEVQQRLLVARQSWFARQPRPAAKARQGAAQSGPDRPSLKRLVGAVASTGGLGCP